MDPFGPPLKRPRDDMFPTVNGSSLQGRGGHGGHDSSFLDSSYRPSDYFLSEREPLSRSLGSNSKACLKFFSTSGCPYGEGCHFTHYVPGGVTALGPIQTSSLSSMKRGTTTMSSFEQGPFGSGLKARMCNNFGTPEGCRFGDKCHFAHGERELRNPNGPVGFVDGMPGLKGYTESTPGLAAAASFGSTSTAKISIDASLAGAVIGKGGVNVRSICDMTGVRIIVRDHESDSKLRNIEMEGSFDQIKQASAMVRELLMNKDINPPKPANLGPHNYKTKMCEKYPQGTCSYGDRCHFAHSNGELRQP